MVIPEKQKNKHFPDFWSFFSALQSNWESGRVELQKNQKKTEVKTKTQKLTELINGWITGDEMRADWELIGCEDIGGNQDEPI